jgi:hypothetical protein
MITIYKVDRQHFELNLQHYRALMEGAYLRNHLGHSADDALTTVLEGGGDLIEVAESSGFCKLTMTTEHIDGTLFITAIVGHGFEYAAPSLDAWLVDYARQCDLKRIALCGRYGWRRLLKAHGFDGELVIMSKGV